MGMEGEEGWEVRLMEPEKLWEGEEKRREDNSKDEEGGQKSGGVRQPYIQ
jgi:hypothetical protein